jgi:hypothetical protein
MKALAVLSNCSKINNKKIFRIRSLAHYMHGSHSAAFRFCLSFLLQKAKLNHLFYEKGAPDKSNVSNMGSIIYVDAVHQPFGLLVFCLEQTQKLCHLNMLSYIAWSYSNVLCQILLIYINQAQLVLSVKIMMSGSQTKSEHISTN